MVLAVVAAMVVAVVAAVVVADSSQSGWYIWVHSPELTRDAASDKLPSSGVNHAYAMALK